MEAVSESQSRALLARWGVHPARVYLAGRSFLLTRHVRADRSISHRRGLRQLQRHCQKTSTSLARTSLRHRYHRARHSRAHHLRRTDLAHHRHLRRVRGGDRRRAGRRGCRVFRRMDRRHPHAHHRSHADHPQPVLVDRVIKSARRKRSRNSIPRAHIQRNWSARLPDISADG